MNPRTGVDQSMRKDSDGHPVISGNTFTGGGTPGLRVNADRTRRPLAWLYGPGRWTGPLVSLGSDVATPTHYRLTVVFRLPGQRAVVVALWKRPYGRDALNGDG